MFGWRHCRNDSVFEDLQSCWGIKDWRLIGLVVKVTDWLIKAISCYDISESHCKIGRRSWRRFSGRLDLKLLSRADSRYCMRGYGAIGSAPDSRSGGWEFDSLWPHSFIIKTMGNLFNRTPQPVVHNSTAEFIMQITYCGVWSYQRYVDAVQRHVD